MNLNDRVCEFLIVELVMHVYLYDRIRALTKHSYCHSA